MYKIQAKFDITHTIYITREFEADSEAQARDVFLGFVIMGTVGFDRFFEATLYDENDRIVATDEDFEPDEDVSPERSISVAGLG